MDLGLILHMNCKDTIDSRNETILIVKKIVQIIWQTFHHDLLLTPVHSLDNEALIIGLEHEASTLTLRLFCFEKHLLILVGIKGLLNHRWGNVVEFTDGLEDRWSKFND